MPREICDDAKIFIQTTSFVSIRRNFRVTSTLRWTIVCYPLSRFMEVVVSIKKMGAAETVTRNV